MKTFSALISSLMVSAADAWSPAAIYQGLYRAAAVAGRSRRRRRSISTDPKHANCPRSIEVVSGTVAKVEGTDGTPSCPVDGSGREWSPTGKIDGETILVDFSPKGGPADLKGVWEVEPIPGIRWPDNNLWALKK